MKPQDLTGAVTKRGPITRIMNGKGIRRWLEQAIVEPGYAYLVTKTMTHNTPAGPIRRACWRCVRGMKEHFDGHAMVTREEKPPKPDERCPRCDRSFGERLASE